MVGRGIYISPSRIPYLCSGRWVHGRNRGRHEPYSKHWNVFTSFNGERKESLCSDHRQGCHCHHPSSPKPHPGSLIRPNQGGILRKNKELEGVGETSPPHCFGHPGGRFRNARSFPKICNGKRGY